MITDRVRFEVSASERATLEAAPSTGTISIAGLDLDAASGEILGGDLDPSNEPLEIPAEVQGIVRPADEVLDPAAINETHNPFKDAPIMSDGKVLLALYDNPSQIFTAKVIVPLRKTVQELAATHAPELAELANVLSENLMYETPAHRFNIDGGIGNRIVFYGGDIGHAHIDQLTSAMRRKHMRLLKAMTHLDSSSAADDGGAQGGTLEEIARDGVGGTTHLGGFTAGYPSKGIPGAVKSDWPADYGTLNDTNKSYNAHILAIDYSKGTFDPIPDATLDAYCRNADMWDCIAAIQVPFANKDLDPNYQDYKYNPLEVHNQASAKAVASALARVDERSFLIDHGAFYCAEGQFCVANLGPQTETLIQQSRFGETRLGQMIELYLGAYTGVDMNAMRQNPRIGWERLRELGIEGGGISQEQFERLEKTDRLGVALEWIPEDVKGWQAYRPRNADGLIARPMTVATIAWSLFRRYLPREALARTLANELARLAKSVPLARAALAKLAGGTDPGDRVGRMAISLVAHRLAAQLLTMGLTAEKTKESILKQAGFGELEHDEDKAKVQVAFDEMVKLVKEHATSPQGVLDNALLEADRKLASLTVARKQLNKPWVLANEENLNKLQMLKAWLQATPEDRAQVSAPERAIYEALVAEQATILEYEKLTYVTKQGTPMLYAGPSCFVSWAQQPFLADTGCIRYVATAMHVAQSRDMKPDSHAHAPAKMSAGVVRAADAHSGRFWKLLGQVFVQKDISEHAFTWYGLIPPGAGMPDLIHVTQDKQIYVLDGSLTLSIDGAESVVTAAGLARIPRGARHAYVNDGSVPVHAMFWALPARKLPALFDKLQGATSLDGLKSIAQVYEIVLPKSGR